MSEKIVKTDEEWAAELTPDQFEVTRRHGTERAFTGAYHDTKTPGVYRCVCCKAQLFDSSTKFDSGSGWPSFFEPAEHAAIATREDVSMGMRRVEVLCAACDAHLGHVFNDGPAPTGQRFCINSLALDLEEKES